MIAGFVAIAVAMVVVFGINAYRESQKYAAAHGTGPDAQQIASLKELAEAIKNPETRDQAIRSLPEADGAQAVDLLAALAFKSKDPEVRAAALTVLGDVGDLRGLQVMTIGARDTEVVVRIAAVEALGKMTNDTALSTIAEALANDVDEAVRKVAAAALAAGKGSAETVDKLVERLRSEDSVEIRGLVATAMGRLEHAGARQALIATLDSKTETEASVRLRALQSLDAVDDHFRVKGAACAIGDVDEAVRSEAKRIFSGLGTNALPAVVDALKSSELLRVIKGRAGTGVHADIFQVVNAMKSPEVAEPLFLLLDLAVEEGSRAEPRVAIRDGAIRALSVLGEPAVAPIARNVLKPGVRWPLKRAAAKVLAAAGEPAVAPLREYINSRIALPSSADAKLWIETLESIGGPEAAAGIEEAKRHDPDEVFGKLATGETTPSELARPPAPQLEEYNLVLYDGFYGGNPPSAYTTRKNNLPFVSRKNTSEPAVRAYEPKSRRNVVLELTRTASGWERAMAHNLTHNNGISFGQITDASVTDEAIDFELKLAIGRDPYLLGGYGEYAVSLRKTGEGRYGGEFTGRYRGIPIKGAAVCTRKPKRRPLAPGFRPVRPDEHPRMLFREWELPRLRAKLNTPLGKAAFRQLLAAGYGHDGGGGQLTARHAALGLLYQLTGDERYAEEAISHTRHQMAQKGFGFRSLGQVWGPRWTNIALAYDLCYDAWPAGFRSEVLSYLRVGSFSGTTQMQKFSVCANNHPCSNYFSPICGGAASMALTYWMKPGGPPPPPGGTELLVPPKLSGRPPEDVPIVPLVSSQQPRQWIWSGLLLDAASPGDMVAALGDLKTDPIRNGRTFSHAGENMSFGAIDPRYWQGSSLYPWVALAQEKPDCGGASMLLYTVLENHRPGFYRVHLPQQGDSLLSVSGTVLPDRSFVHFEEGLYPLLLAYSGQKDMVAGIGAAFKFITASREEIDILLAEGADKAKREQVLYELAMAEHKATGMEGKLVTPFQMSRVNMYRSHRLLMGDGGFQSEGEGYTHTSITPLRYAAHHWNVFGQTVTPHPDVTHFPTRYIATSALYPGGSSRGRVRRSSLVSQGFNGGGGSTHGVTFISAGFRIIPEEHQPAVLWVWNKLKGVEEGKPETLANLVEGLATVETINTFVNYPLDMKPVHPRERITKTWRAKTKGLHVFRNAWEDQNDIILLAYANELRTHGNCGPDAGGLRLMGFGRRWTHEGQGKRSGDWGNNIPLMIRDGAVLGSSRGTGRVVDWHGEEDGSGGVSINMDLIYNASRGLGHDRGGVWPLKPTPPLDITGIRALAVDYSGNCGAPALIVLVDKIEGGPERHWSWPLPGRAGDMRVETDRNTFTIHQGDVSLHATFVAPADVTVKSPGTVDLMPTENELKRMKSQIRSKKERDAFTAKEQAMSFDILATAPEGASFFVVMTMQKGTPPEVTVARGEGLRSVVAVGEKRVRFDGEKAIIEDATPQSGGSSVGGPPPSRTDPQAP